jgi:predicted ABC-type transport system involved in lysophospholipase L1 biosynthesis ATPase subunit
MYAQSIGKQVIRVSNPSENDLALELKEVSRIYSHGKGRVRALNAVSLCVKRGEMVALVGPSGSGKTTLLNLIAGLDRPTDGEVTTLGQRLNGLRESGLTTFRARSVGLVFQDPHLLPGLTALENVVVARLPWQSRRKLIPEAEQLLSAVGLAERLDFPPARMSGGERQRVGIARALLGHRSLLLGDEPTGNLDTGTTQELLALLEQLRLDFGLTLVIATHDSIVAGRAQRVVHLENGQILDEQGDVA